MNPHHPRCHRGKWLLRQPRGAALFWVVLLREGPPCTCRSSSSTAPEAT